uniref:dTDP-D-glucose 4,6-dehydratase n=1 Tax=Oryzias latipes TaxID=8090 RepID=A0A3B3H5B6_ORYLA
MGAFERTVLVTGGSGFIGSHLVCSLVCEHPDWRIINLDQLDSCCSPRSLRSVEDRRNYTFVQGDVCDPSLLDRLFSAHRIDVVFHLAARTHVEASFQNPASFQRVNVEGTRTLLRAAQMAQHRPQRFLYISTDEVYGAGADRAFDERSPLRPANPYAVSKAAAENLVRFYWDRYQLPVIITRSNNIYGPRQHSEKVIPRFLSLLQQNNKCTIQGTAPKSRHFLFVSDAIAAFLLLLEKGAVGEVYNVGSSWEVPILGLAQQLVKTVRNVPDSEVGEWLEFVPDRWCGSGTQRNFSGCLLLVPPPCPSGALRSRTASCNTKTDASRSCGAAEPQQNHHMFYGFLSSEPELLD